MKCAADVVLFLTNIRLLSVTTVNMVYGIPAGFSRSLKWDSDFVYWDAKRREILAYGKLSDEESAGFAITKEEWESFTNDLARDLLLDGRLQRPGLEIE